MRGMGRVLLGFSGGVDSALLAVVGARVLGPERFLAVIGLSASYSAVQRRTAHALVERFSIPWRELRTRELEDPRYAANSTDRCYYCKRELWERLGQLARRLGFDTLIDGTLADDLAEHRPGLRAAEEYRVRSPLAELGWTKPAVRREARALELPVWDAPAAPCLSSRIRYGLEVTPARLRQVEEAEAVLRALGIEGDLRVRHLGDGARIEVESARFTLLRQQWTRIEREFARLGFATVTLAPEGYRRGALLSLTA